MSSNSGSDSSWSSSICDDIEYWVSEAFDSLSNLLIDFLSLVGNIAWIILTVIYSIAFNVLLLVYTLLAFLLSNLWFDLAAIGLFAILYIWNEDFKLGVNQFCEGLHSHWNRAYNTVCLVCEDISYFVTDRLYPCCYLYSSPCRYVFTTFLEWTIYVCGVRNACGSDLDKVVLLARRNSEIECPFCFEHFTEEGESPVETDNSRESRGRPDDVVRSPLLLTECGHYYCSGCISEFRRMSLPCPECSLPFDTKTNKVIRNLYLVRKLERWRTEGVGLGVSDQALNAESLQRFNLPSPGYIGNQCNSPGVELAQSGMSSNRNSFSGSVVSSVSDGSYQGGSHEPQSSGTWQGFMFGYGSMASARIDDTQNSRYSNAIDARYILPTAPPLALSSSTTSEIEQPGFYPDPYVRVQSSLSQSRSNSISIENAEVVVEGLIEVTNDSNRARSDSNATSATTSSTRSFKPIPVFTQDFEYV